MKVSIQGNLGSYSHIASEHLLGEGIEIVERDSFQEVFSDLEDGLVDHIVIPIENSTHGSIYQNYDLLTKNKVRIIGEVYLKINFHLISFLGTSINEIQELYTHPVGLSQIQNFLQKNKHIKAIEYPDTAGSVKYIKDNNLKRSAAAASKKAATINQMSILEENIQSNRMNYTRFFLLERNSGEWSFSKDANKTSLELTLGEESGSLFQILKPFAERNIALIKIESRPIINTHWQFTFYIDVKAGIKDLRMIDALNELKKIAKTTRVIGSYKKGEYINT